MSAAGDPVESVGARRRPRRRRARILLALVVLLALSQAPFAYRRYQLGRLRARIAEANSRRAPAPLDDDFGDHAGVFHVHSSLGGHTTGRPEEIVSAARANGLAFVVMTEHPASHVNTAEATLKGEHEGVVFINGSELVARGGERLFVAPGFDRQPPEAESVSLQQLINLAATENRLALVAYPGQVRDWRLDGYDGLEVYNLYTDARDASFARLFFDGLWSYWSYPELLFVTFYDRPAANLSKWDELNAAGARRSAVAGNDAHANVGLSLGGREGESLFSFRLDPYERSFRIVRNHVLLPKGERPTAENVLAALRRGRSYMAFDLFCDSSGFRFAAEAGAARASMGEEVTL
ncbi:MAG TPA: hypothetical protein VD968_17615, partial [Pyrinomonadaceae bacterium]|nr:hypothetical protein [Pyrinomonadaceae bacterium]